MITLAYDIETDGLNSKRIHCIVTQDIDTGLVEEYNDEKYTEEPKELPMGSNYSITTGLTSLMSADTIISHNGISYDVPQIEKHYPFFRDCNVKHYDTLILSRFYHPNLLEVDLKRQWVTPTRLQGSHSLEAWGYRLKCYKGEFAKVTDWKEWSPDMQAYCKQDVAILAKLWHHFQKYLNPSS